MLPENHIQKHADVLNHLRRKFTTAKDEFDEVTELTVRKLIAAKIIKDRGRYRDVRDVDISGNQVLINWYDPYDNSDDYPSDKVDITLFNAYMEDAIKERNFDITKYEENL